MAAYYSDLEREMGKMVLTAELMTRIGSNIQVSRTIHGHSQKDIADAAGVSISQFAQIEAGKRVPSLATYIRITEALKVSPDSLFYGEQISTNQEKNTRVYLMAYLTTNCRKMIRSSDPSSLQMNRLKKK